MTKKELIELLDDVPDNAVITVSLGDKPTKSEFDMEDGFAIFEPSGFVVGYNKYFNSNNIETHSTLLTFIL